MGCRCDTIKEANIGEFKFDEEPDINNSNRNILKNKRNSLEKELQEIHFIQNKFLEEIKQKDDYAVLDSIDIKEYLTYECLQAFETYTNEKKKFMKYFEKNDNLDLINNNLEISNDNNSNISNEEKIKVFKMPPIKYLKNDTIYEGEFFYDEKNSQYSYGGNGILITPNKELIQIKNQPKKSDYIKNGTIFYPNGDIFIGSLMKEDPYLKIKGILFENINGHYENHTKSNNFNDEPPFITKYFNNGDIYEGEAKLIENRIIFDGKGQLTKKNKNTIFRGNFSGNLYNGKGKLFKPLGGLSQQKNIQENIGKTIISNWINGKPNGNGIIQEKYSNDDNIKNVTCSFRFGKIIKYISCLVKGKKILNENIFCFLNIREISNLSKNLKTKSFYNYLKKNNNLNFNKIKMYRTLCKNDIGNYQKDLFNYDIFKLNINNLDNIIKNIYENQSVFLPFVCYKTNGGEIENRYRAFHIFDPDMNKIYSTHYLFHKDTNVTINGIFNRNFYEKFMKNEGNTYDLNEINVENLLFLASLYKNFYERFVLNYPVRDVSKDIIEFNKYILSEDKIGNYNNILNIFQYITIFIPDKKDEYTVLINPCYFLAVYIGRYNDNNQIIENENQNEINTSSKKYCIDINDEEIRQFHYNIKLIREKYHKYIINNEEDNNLEYIEFDTNNQKEFEYKILCLVKIKKKNLVNKPYLINLKKFYHLGNAVNVKLINQLNAYNANERGYSIDFGTINFYGDVIYLNE